MKETEIEYGTIVSLDTEERFETDAGVIDLVPAWLWPLRLWERDNPATHGISAPWNIYRAARNSDITPGVFQYNQESAWDNNYDQCLPVSTHC
jgi:hypothetical protein